MKEITHEELKQIQLEILDKVHAFCEKNGIRYSLSSGTLIGAVRHKGYIPWDDDLDIYMLRPDYDKFIRTFSENPPEHMKLLSLETSKTYPYAFAKVVDSRTELVEHFYGENLKIGVFLDVFPLESVPDNPIKFLFRFCFLHYLKFFSGVLCVQMEKTNFFKKARTPTRRIIKFLVYFPKRLLSYRFFLETYDAFAKRHDPNSKYVYNMSAGIGMHGCFRRSAFAGTVDVEFEGKLYKAMRGYKEYLYVTYGDFMQLPPPEKQISNHHFTAWWKE